MVYAADAGALAGAASLNQGSAVAEAVAVAAARANGASDATAVAYTTSSPNGVDTIRVTANAPGKPYFSKLFGVGGFDIRASAVARVDAYTSLESKPLFPIAITPDSIPSFGDEVTLKFGGGGCSTGNCGAIDLPFQENGCGAGGGGAAARAVGRDARSLRGAGGRHAVDRAWRQGGADPAGAGRAHRLELRHLRPVVRTDPSGGLSTIINVDSPRLVEVPIVVNANDGSNSWPNGRGSVPRDRLRVLLHHQLGWRRGEGPAGAGDREPAHRLEPAPSPARAASTRSS